VQYLSRRTLLAGTIALAGAALLPTAVDGESMKTRLILLGTGGGPRPRKASSASAQVIVSNNTAYVIDCGNGVARQLVFANVPLTTLRHIFLTHQHSDHNADYGNLIWLAWESGLSTRVVLRPKAFLFATRSSREMKCTGTPKNVLGTRFSHA
jgi:ribonuclease BN (tRNA processing enzyme)